MGATPNTPINDGGMAFPRAGGTMPNGNRDWPENGMTLRDYFAAKAMQGLLSAGQAELDAPDDRLANWAYVLADAMIKAKANV